MRIIAHRNLWRAARASQVPGRTVRALRSPRSQPTPGQRGPFARARPSAATSRGDNGKRDDVAQGDDCEIERDERRPRATTGANAVVLAASRSTSREDSETIMEIAPFRLWTPKEAFPQRCTGFVSRAVVLCVRV